MSILTNKCNLFKILAQDVYLLNNIRFKSQTSSEYCLNLVRTNDYENFVCTLFLKNPHRSSALAIRSFNIEVSKISERVSQVDIGRMRLKFWEETIDKCFQKDPLNVPQHPVALEIYKASLREKLTKRHFKTLIISRSELLNKNSFNTMSELETYAEKTVSTVYYLILESCGIKNIHADHAASHIGKAQGITQLLRTIPLAKKINFIAIPQDILVNHKVSHEDVLRNKISDNMVESCLDLASRANEHLVKARDLMSNVPSQAKTVFLPTTAVDNYLNRLSNVQYNVFHPSLLHRSWFWLPKLWLTNYKNKY
ncbi:NADH dehydrogenase (ubiquinone) complex I, assembly factor 6 [Onthophagus taurus]|uniref:NADH dehydrogenase (ubiquinone) complex I, assembly factor 6 n=1 Tax=Onthophagus taurus TaxID=166361 RepID=UPI000C20DCAE|nr:NADH dehydrogenase (ubiquinone) complex I, assembly factor 6 [Onthophagus taurus]